NQLGSQAGRMSCSDPNMQQLPRDKAYRRCVAAPPARALVKADYSQIELRIAARITGDRRMLGAYAKGEDLHTLTARRMTGKQEVSKEERQVAKPVNFGLIYGMGAKALCGKAKSDYGIDLSLEQAEAYRRAFFRTYAGVRRWHRSFAEGTVETRTLAGR